VTTAKARDAKQANATLELSRNRRRCFIY
jgi:hypothetical protein